MPWDATPPPLRIQTRNQSFIYLHILSEYQANKFTNLLNLHPSSSGKGISHNDISALDVFDLEIIFFGEVGYRVFNTMSILLDQDSSSTRSAGIHL